MQSRSVWHSFACAFAGIWYALRHGRNAKIQLAIAAAVSLVAAWLNLAARDWALVVLTFGLILAAEIANTAIESAVDLSSPEHHELAKVAKDAAAGAVLAVSMTSAAVWLLALGPPIWERLFG